MTARSRLGRMNAGLRLAAFATVYAAHQLAGLLLLAFLTLAGRSRDHDAHRRVQGWWIDSLLGWARRLLGFEIRWPEVELPPEQFLILSRHCSPVDAALPAHWVAHSHDRPVHYVLKRQLRFDPCISLFGKRLGNAFIDRSDGPEAIETIRTLSRHTEPRAAIVIFPEGTYATPERRRQTLARFERAEDPSAAAMARSLHTLLPPRHAGTLAALEELPDADVVVIAPLGLDGLNNLGALLRRIPLQEPITVLLQIVPRSRIPTGGSERKEWLNAMWLSLDAAIAHQPRTTEPPWISPSPQ